MATLKEKIRNSTDKAKEALKKSIICLYKFCFCWTIILLLMTVVEFLKWKFQGHTLGLTSPMANAYLALLGAYAASKEVGRWTKTPKTDRMGEVFVYLWWSLLLVIFSVQFLFPTYELPSEMMGISLKVLVIFFGSETSKFINSKIRPGKSESS